MKRVLLLLPTTGYRNNDFLAAADKRGVEIVPATDYCHQLAPSWGLAPNMAPHFDRIERAADTVLWELDASVDAVLAMDDSGVEIAALLAECLGLPGALQDRMHREVARASRVASLSAGSIHAELRVNDQGICILEVAARSVGGSYGRVLIHSPTAAPISPDSSGSRGRTAA